MSSDSEDDCYGNAAQKLQSLKKKFVLEKPNASFTIEVEDTFLPQGTPVKENTSDNVILLGEETTHNVSTDSIENDENNILDKIIAENASKKRKTSIGSNVTVENILPSRSRRRRSKAASKSPLKRPKKGKNSNSTTQNAAPSQSTANSAAPSQITANSAAPSQSTVNSAAPSQNTVNSAAPTQNTVNSTTASQNSTASSQNIPPSVMTSARSIADYFLREFAQRGRRGRGRGPRRGRGRGRGSPMNSDYPVFSIGNTFEYPDYCHEQELFQNKTEPVTVEENEENDIELDNEELSVKVYWQNLEYVKFSIRKYQKLLKIFDHFAEKENVTQDKLLFTYNDKILKSTDTPDSINYNIAKFIDGGIINQSVSKLVKQTDNEESGVKLKFQCQTLKVPFLTSIKEDDKIYVAMVKCAEHLEMPLEKLKFYFDGDLITGKSTPVDLEIEDGGCIDVKIVS